LLLERLRAEARTAQGRARLAAWPGDFWQFLDALPERAAKKSSVDFAALARRIGPDARERALLPARATLDLFLADLHEQDRTPHTVAGPLLENLLGQVYDIDYSPAMQVFQNYAL